MNQPNWMSPEDTEMVLALGEQVRRAIPPGGNEHDVHTMISRPMWRRFLSAVQLDTELDPDPDPGKLGVWGSRTSVIDGAPQFFAISCGRLITGVEFKHKTD